MVEDNDVEELRLPSEIIKILSKKELIDDNIDVGSTEFFKKRKPHIGSREETMHM